MNKTKITHIITVALAFVAMLLPWGAVCRFISQEQSGLQQETFKTYSYFDLFPLTHSNFAPFMCAVMTVLLLLLLGYLYFSDETKPLQIAMVVLSCVAFALSLFPLIFYGIKFFNMTALTISFLLGCSAFMSAQRITGLYFQEEEQEDE